MSRHPDSSLSLNRVVMIEYSCGVFGLYAPEEEVAKLTYFGLYALQHRGQESAGIATYDGETVHCYK
ncbi:MAG: amidophosphoribosyltransferase, partial [Microcystis sp.]